MQSFHIYASSRFFEFYSKVFFRIDIQTVHEVSFYFLEIHVFEFRRGFAPSDAQFSYFEVLKFLRFTNIVLAAVRIFVFKNFQKFINGAIWELEHENLVEIIGQDREIPL